ncbi:MAG: GspH/FimT family pseudopilin [Gemmatimonadaceae bacterium]
MQRPRPAFSLIEVVLVLTLIGIVAGWAITNLRASGYQMDSNVRLLQNAMIGAQQTAITRNVTVQVMFDATLQRIRILQDADDDGTASESEVMSYRPLFDGARFLTPATTLDGALPYYLTGPGVIETGNPLQRAIRITPNGALSGDVVVYLGTTAARPNDMRALTIIGATARTGFWSHATGAWRQRDY